MDDLEEDYSSSDDSDYVPEAAVSDSDSGEEGQGENDEVSNKRGKETKKDSQLKRKRKGGIKLEGEEDGDVDEKCVNAEQEQRELEQERKALEEEEKRAKELEEEEKEKKKADDLWQSLLSDVGPRPKASSTSTSSGSKINSSAKNETSKEVAPGEKGDATKSNQKTIKVTKTFDFAGEEVKVTKDVAVDSDEAKKKPEQSAMQTSGQLPMGGKRKPGGIGAVLGKLNKKPKISVLEKSKLDWDTFKKKEGIEEDLRIHNKGKEGFLQKQDFLRETDLRQYEIERKMRLGQSGR